MSRYNKVRAAKDYGKKFRSELALSFRGIVHYRPPLNFLKFLLKSLTTFRDKDSEATLTI